MTSPDLHPTWIHTVWPPKLIPLALGSDLSPIENMAPVGAANQDAFFFVAPGASILHPDLIRIVFEALSRRPDVGVFYADDAAFDEKGDIIDVSCKPSFNAALMLADDYLGFPLLFRADQLEKLLRADDGRFGAAMWYQLCLDALSGGICIDRIPHTLLASPNVLPRVTAQDRAEVLGRWFAIMGEPFSVHPGRVDPTLELRRTFRHYPEVTIVVPTRQSGLVGSDGAIGRPHITACLDGIARSSYPQDRITVLVGDDCHDDAVYSGRRDAFSLRRIDTAAGVGERFNYAAKMNRLWQTVETDAMIFMNDDVVVDGRGWIEALLTYAIDPNVGGVGARLLFPDGRVQHAGMFGGIFGVCAHPWYLEDAKVPTYRGWAETPRDCSAVTGAVFATRRGPMQAVNGFDEELTLDFNDVDLCFKMRTLGYRIVYTPYAELTHYEKASRSVNVAPGDQVALYMRRWHDVLHDDPMFSPQLRNDTAVVAPKPFATAWISGVMQRFGPQSPG